MSSNRRSFFTHLASGLLAGRTVLGAQNPPAGESVPVERRTCRTILPHLPY